MRRYYEAWFRRDPSEMGTLDPYARRREALEAVGLEG